MLLLPKPGTNDTRPVTIVVVTDARLSEKKMSHERKMSAQRTIDRREMHLCQSGHR